MRGIALTRASDTGMPRPVGPAARRRRGGAARRWHAPSAGFPGKARRHGAAKAWPRPIRPPCPGTRPRHHSRPARSSPGIEPPRARRPPWLPKPSSQRRQPLAHARGGGRQGTRRSARGASHRPGARSPARRRPGRAAGGRPCERAHPVGGSARRAAAEPQCSFSGEAAVKGPARRWPRWRDRPQNLRRSAARQGAGTQKAPTRMRRGFLKDDGALNDER